MTKRWWLVVGAAIALAGVAGGTWWAVRGSDEGKVAARICGGSLPGSPAAALLPKHDASRHTKMGTPISAKNPSPGVWCGLYGDKATLLFSYAADAETYRPEVGVGVAKAQHDALLRLGQARGLTSSSAAELYLSCGGVPDVNNSSFRWLKVRVSLASGQAAVTGRQAEKYFAELVGDAARHVSKKLGCKDAADLPEDTPGIG
ncbi:hypothetical protein [Streptomyces sp. NPDC093060]|uniref:hypothetical protein n=1 Tax=Streptomyces sp. NPDC093060 TaxID=3366019 RepID=UPI0038182C38